MPSKRIDFETVRQLALALPGVEDSTTHGAPAFKLRGRLLTCQAINRSAEANSPREAKAGIRKCQHGNSTIWRV